MSVPPRSRMQNMLQAAVQSVQWTYSLFWQLCPQQGMLVWGDGYYNGAIKTRKTVQPMEVSAEEASAQRSQQLRELYESLSAEENNQPAKRPCASLSPEDLTESEWFYLMCVSFTFPPGAGLPGKALARRQHVWLTGANEVDSKTFSRAILAKSARIQTVVCIPLLDGVIELGTTDKVQEDLALIQHVKTFFTDHIGNHPTPPKPALSEHSTSNPASSTDHTRFHCPPIPAMYTVADPPANAHQVEDDDEEEDDEEEEHGSDSEADTGRNVQAQNNAQNVAGSAERSELMQLEMSEDIRLGSPDDASNNLESDFKIVAGGKPGDIHRRIESFRAESTRRWAMMQDPTTANVQPNSSGQGRLEELSQDDTHYSQTVSTILQNRPVWWSESSSTAYMSYSNQSAFAKWTTRSDQNLHVAVDGTSQWLLKYILFTTPFLHNKYREENSPKSRDGDSFNRFRKGNPRDELSANHVLAERRRREKLNERFIILRSLVPFVTKMDKASILGDTIEYVKQLRKKIQDLEARNHQMEKQQRSRSTSDPSQRTSSFKERRSGVITSVERTRSGSAGAAVTDMKKMRMAEGNGGVAKPKSFEMTVPLPQTLPEGETTIVEVSIIERDALLELQCSYREGLLLDIMQMLREQLRIETTAVQSSVTNGIFVAELRAKVKDTLNGKKISIVEVKRAIRQIIPQD